MARIRTIKPEFWTDDNITECSLSARLLFIGMWNFADDYGNLDRSAKQIKARILPVDNIDCEPLVLELIDHGLLIEYSVNGKRYLHIQGFTEHQFINRPSKPACPDYDASLIVQATLNEPLMSTHAGREGKGKEEEGIVRNSHDARDEIPPPRKRSVISYTPEFENFWGAYPRNSASKQESLKSYNKAVNGGTTHAAIERGARAYAAFVSANRTEGKYIKHATTWLNQRCWESDYSIPPSRFGASGQQPARPTFTSEAQRIAAEFLAQPEGQGAANAGYGADLRIAETVRQDISQLENHS